MNELDEGSLSAAAGKQDKQAELGVPHSRIQVELD